MHKIALISLCVPTFNNVRAASALPYHLILGARAAGDCKFSIWTYNTNALSAEEIKATGDALGAEIHLLRTPKWMTAMFRLHLSFLRMLLRYPYLSYLRLSRSDRAAVSAFKPDTVWIYGEEIAAMAEDFGGERIVTMPDSEAMYYHRVLATDFMTDTRLKRLRYTLAGKKYRALESAAGEMSRVKFHFVGKEDAEFFSGECPEAKAFFLPHPHYAFRSREIHFHTPKIRLLFAGRYDIYSAIPSDALIREMISRSDELRDKYEVTFLGSGWDTANQAFHTAGWTSNVIAFAPDYITELQRHDIQINAIGLGTGTKGKVLDAIANGLLAFGTDYALENIAVKSGESCILYRSPGESVDILARIPEERARYERMAESGRKYVLSIHNPEKIAASLFSLQ